MTALDCPHCAQPIVADADGLCRACGFDASLLLEIQRAAAGLAREAARQAAEGAWQAAYDAAERSLGLVRRDNDLAAFVLIAATLGGAQGSVAAVPRPRAAALPPPLAPWADRAVQEVNQLLALRDGGAADGEIAAKLRQLDPRHPLLPPRAGVLPRRVAALTAAAAVAVLVAGTAAGRWSGVVATRHRLDPQLAALAGELRMVRQAPRPVAAAVPAGAAPPAEPWLQALHDLPAPTHAAVRESVCRDAWLRGYAASVHHRYDDARRLLAVAAQATPASYYRRDAIYYLAKACHRLGRREEARQYYLRLQQEAPRSSYAREASRLLARLEKGQGVDR